MPTNPVFDALAAHAESLREEFGFVGLSIFGSVARGEDTQSRDVDMVVDFGEPATFVKFMALRERLEELLGRPVDLVTTKALRPELREQIEGEALSIA